MRTPDQRGRYGRWLVAARESRGWDTAQKALDAMAAAGIRIGKSTYAEYESGAKVPSRNHLPLLESYWGPAPEPVEATQTPDALVSAISLLVEEIRAERAERQEWERSFVEAIRELARLDTPRVGPAPALLGDVRR